MEKPREEGCCLDATPAWKHTTCVDGGVEKLNVEDFRKCLSVQRAAVLSWNWWSNTLITSSRIRSLLESTHVKLFSMWDVNSWLSKRIHKICLTEKVQNDLNHSSNQELLILSPCSSWRCDVSFVALDRQFQKCDSVLDQFRSFYGRFCSWLLWRSVVSLMLLWFHFPILQIHDSIWVLILSPRFNSIFNLSNFLNDWWVCHC